MASAIGSQSEWLIELSQSVVPASFETTDVVHLAPTLGSYSVGGGKLKVVPYGAFWADMVYSSRRTNTSAFTLWVFSAEDQGESTFVIDARRSRFGLNVEGERIPALGDAVSRGQVEIDFQGEFVVENRAGVLLRQAYWEVENDSFRLLVGQHWDVISPRIPSALNYSVGWLGGNIGFRRAQFRGERHFSIAEELNLALQASLNQDIIPDFPTDETVRRESSNWPVIEGRLALSNPEVWEVGVSGHIGETGFDFLEVGPPTPKSPTRGRRTHSDLVVQCRRSCRADRETVCSG